MQVDPVLVPVLVVLQRAPRRISGLSVVVMVKVVELGAGSAVASGLFRYQVYKSDMDGE